MEKLWAPWRMKFLEEVDKSICIFCEKPKQKNDKENFILYRGRYSFIIMNIYPYNNGHLMIAPYSHKAELEDLEDDEILEMMRLSQLSIKSLKKKLNPDAFNMGLNLGKVAGAGFIGHLHIHVVPRWQGDTNFMPIIGETKVLSEYLDESYEKILQGLKELE